MAEVIVGGLGVLTAGLTSIAVATTPIGAAALLAWCGFRLAAKLTNRGVGK